MKAKEIQEILAFITKSGLEEVNIETGDFKIKVKKNQPEPKTTFIASSPTAPAPAPTPAAAPAPAPIPVAAPATPATPTPEPAAESNLIEIKSPMIGTFYRSSDPKSDAFVKVGDTVKPGKTVCIVEAMKLFNEIESEVSGKIVKVLVDDASPVEYDQPLFLVDPS